ncbi:LysE family translocator [Pedosphaera parvula]|uniref:Lysine exporter protein (LYSE/YGGA) n=1 Tax=Pedosphaera parvula (strain Ellin514) TaxID=320771 RepID=B9XRF9_PEDPL|nr:LysE family transporter [Pedosphaera parvula]EEF57593.1 Lysine exporter protein (LYSE/YGGA) [Pedosphaera parvula Ellin514]
MSDLYPTFIAILTGFLSGLILSIPVGPINATIINEGARRGFKWAALIGIGASLMEVIYCGFAFSSFASFFSKGLIQAAMELVSFVFMLGLGLKFLMTTTVPHASKVEEKIEIKLHPHSAFMTGFVRVMANPGVFLGWVILGAHFISHEWVQPTWESKGFCVLGVLLGTLLWFLGLSWAVSLGHRKFKDKTLVRMQKASGICLLVFAAINGVHMILALAKK